MTARTQWSGVWAPVLLVVAVAVTFANSVHEGFHFDDRHSLVENPYIRSLAAIPDFFVDPQSFSRNRGSEMYRPLVLLSYALTYRLFDYQAVFYHLTNVVIHVLVALLVYAVYRRVGLRDTTSLGAALLFALHPLVCEPVNYVSSRSESLAALFFLAGLWCYIDAKRWVPALACFGAALACKSSAITFPAVLLAYDLLLRQRVGWWRLLPFVLVGMGYLALVGRLLREAVIDAPVRTWPEQIWTQAKALVYYGKLLVVPNSLSVEHQFAVSAGSEPAVVAAVAFTAGLVLALWRVRHMRPLLFWAAVGVAVLLPTAIVPLNVLVNERRLYLALVALLGGLAWMVETVPRSRLGPWVVIAPAVLLAALAAQRNAMWYNEKALWADARIKAPLMVRPHVRMGVIHRAEGNSDAAERAYAVALALDPDHAPAHNNSGNLHRDKGDSAAAEAAYRRAIVLLPGYVDALTNLGTLLGDQGRFGEALPLFERALQYGGARVEVLNNLGTAHMKMGNFNRAEAALRRGLGLGAPTPRLFFNLGGALEGQGRAAAAAAAYAQALAIDSTYARAHYNLALLRDGEGNVASAMAGYRAFLRHWHGTERFRAQARDRLRVLAAGNR